MLKQDLEAKNLHSIKSKLYVPFKVNHMLNSIAASLQIGKHTHPVPVKYH